jgi:hypothetical protein
LAKITLPWPCKFFSVRRDALLIFKPKPSNKTPTDTQVGQNILKLCGQNPNPKKKLGVVVGLQYGYDLKIPAFDGWNPSVNYHFYMEPDGVSDITHLNTALVEARDIFKSPTEFDLQLDPSAEGSPTPLEIEDLPPGVNPEDELGIEEPFPTKGVSSTRPAQPPKAKQLGRTLSLEVYPEPFVNLNPANCPNFYVGP